MDPALVKALSITLENYRQAITRTADREAKEDYLKLASISEKIIAAMQADDLAQVKLGILGFSRQVSDSFSTQPPEYKLLSQKIAELRRLLV